MLIILNQPTAFTGRNGTFKMKGLQLTESVENKIILRPVTSLDNTGNCMLSINKEDIDAVIDMLKRFKN